MADLADHEHWFHAFWSHFGQYGPQDVHYHPCCEGEPGECYAVIMGAGRECGGQESPHERMVLTEDGPQPAEALARLRSALSPRRSPDLSRFDHDPEAIAWARGKVTRLRDKYRGFEQSAVAAGKSEQASMWRKLANMIDMQMVGGKTCSIAAFDERLPGLAALRDDVLRDEHGKPVPDTDG